MGPKSHYILSHSHALKPKFFVDFSKFRYLKRHPICVGKLFFFIQTASSMSNRVPNQADWRQKSTKRNC